MEALLFAHKARIQHHQKFLFPPPSINYTSGAAPYSFPTNFTPFNFRGGARCSRGCDRARGGRFANFQCQICLKYGHTANMCHFRADPNFKPDISLVLYDPTTQQPLYSASSFNIASSATTSSSVAASTQLVPGFPSAMLTSSTSPATTISWVPDSGASFHLTNDSQNIQQFKTLVVQTTSMLVMVKVCMFLLLVLLPFILPHTLP